MNLAHGLRQRRRLDRLDHVLRADDALEVRVDHFRARQQEAFLLVGDARERAEDRVELTERAVRPQNEATEMAARRQLEQIEARDFLQRDARNVAERVNEAAVVVVDDDRAALLLVAAIAALALAGALTLRRVDLE